MHEEEVAKKVVEEAAEVDDQLGWTIRCIRAMEKGHSSSVRKCVRAYGVLASLVSKPEGAI